MRTLLLSAILSFTILPAISHAGDSSYPPLKTTGDTASYGRNIQRTMRRLAASTPENRNTVRILFYGQSITEQGWWKLVAEDLRKRFPNANLIIENRAIGGHSSQLLVKTAEADLFPFYPDLLIFHVYGAHDKYEDIFRHVRERTTAEVLQQDDHVTKPEDLTEETDAAKLAPGKSSWDAFMNHNWLPYISRKYGTELCDQRSLWKSYLSDYQLKPSDLLKDQVHLNPHGEFVMASIVDLYLRYDPSMQPAPADAWIKTFKAGEEIPWKDGKLTADFEGNKIDALLRPVANGAAAKAQVLIDGKKPSEFPGAYAFTRTSAYPGSNWPCLLKVGSSAPLHAEEWTLTLNNVSADLKTFQFDLAGSSTGPDGSGDSGSRFVSKSGRVVIDPEDWNLQYCLAVFKKPVESGFQVKWRAEQLGADEISIPPKTQAGVENLFTIAQGIPNGKHRIEITGPLEQGIAALRAYAPPLKPAESNGN